MTDKTALLEKMELESAQLRAQLLNNERIVREMRAQVQGGAESIHSPPSSSIGGDIPMDSLTSSFRQLQKNRELNGNGNVSASSEPATSGDPQGQVMMSTLLRKASTLATGGKVSVNYKDLMKDLILSDHPGIKAAITKSDYDDGKELRAALESIMFEKMRQEKSALYEQLAQRESLLKGGERSAAAQAAAASLQERKASKDQAEFATLQKKLQRLNATQGMPNSSFGVNNNTNAFSSPPPFPVPAPVNKTQQQQFEAAGNLGSLSAEQLQALLQQASARSGNGINAGSLFQAPPLPGSGQVFGANTNATSQLNALQQMLLATNANSSKNDSGLGNDSRSGDIGSFGSNLGGTFPLPPPPPINNSNRPIKTENSIPTSLHLSASSNGLDMGSKRSRPDSMQNFITVPENNRVRPNVGATRETKSDNLNPVLTAQLTPEQRNFLAKKQALLDKNSVNFSSALGMQMNQFAGLEQRLQQQLPTQGIESHTNGSAAASTFSAAFDQIQGLSKAGGLNALSLASSQMSPAPLPPANRQQVSEDTDGFSSPGAAASRPDIAINTREYVKSGAPSAAPRRWTTEEDQLLKDAVGRHNGKNWKAIADEVPGRNHVQCLQRWRKALDPGVVKGHWTEEEDHKLIVLAGENPKNWGHVAKGIEGRTAKQCRERYHNHLDPSIKKGDWTPQEDRIIMEKQKELGNKWAQIAQFLAGRTENSVKIRWKSIQRFNAGSSNSGGSP